MKTELLACLSPLNVCMCVRFEGEAREWDEFSIPDCTHAIFTLQHPTPPTYMQYIHAAIHIYIYIQIDILSAVDR